MSRAGHRFLLSIALDNEDDGFLAAAAAMRSDPGWDLPDYHQRSGAMYCAGGACRGFARVGPRSVVGDTIAGEIAVAR